MIHTWLKDPSFAPVGEVLGDDAVFLPVEIDGSTVRYLGVELQEAIAIAKAMPDCHRKCYYSEEREAIRSGLVSSIPRLIDQKNRMDKGEV